MWWLAQTKEPEYKTLWTKVVSVGGLWFLQSRLRKKKHVSETECWLHSPNIPLWQMQIYEVCSQPPEFKTGGDEPNDINDILLMMICEIKLKFAGLVWFTKHQFLIVISQEYNHNRLFYNPEISAWEYILQNGIGGFNSASLMPPSLWQERTLWKTKQFLWSAFTRKIEGKSFTPFHEF